MKTHEIQNLIKEILEKLTTVEKVSIDEEKPNNLSLDKTTWFSVEVKDPHFFHEHNGEALNALNHLVKRIVESKNPSSENTEGLGVLVDINGFQKRKVESILAVAHMMAERARYFKSNIEVDPMSAFERRIVHEFLSTATDLKTESQGEGRSRRVVIKYIGAI